MLTCDELDAHEELQTKLAHAERSMRSIRRAARRVAILLLLCLAGLGYCVVLLPEFVEGRPHVLLQFFYTILLACLICLTGYSGVWLWHGRLARKIHEECRSLLLNHAQAKRDHEAPIFRGITLADSQIRACNLRGRDMMPASDSYPAIKAP